MVESEPSISLLRRENNIGYGLMELPTERDVELRTLLERHSVADLSVQVCHDMFPVLRVFAERAASLAVRDADTSLLRIGLQALALTGLNSRESLTILPLFMDASERVGVDPRVLFGTVGNAVGRQIRKLLEDFIERDPPDRSLECMGYEIAGEGQSFRYRRSW